MKLMSTVLKSFLLGASLSLAAPVVIAESGSHMEMGDSALHIMKAWVRPTVKSQTSTGGYLKIMAHADGKITGVSSDISDRTEIHEMSMDGDVMRMRRVESVEVEEGDIINFKPGGYHVMFMGLKAPISKDQTVVFQLEFQDKDGAISSIPVKAVATMTGQMGHDHDHSHEHEHSHSHAHH